MLFGISPHLAQNMEKNALKMYILDTEELTKNYAAAIRTKEET